MSHLVSKINFNFDNETLIFYILEDSNHHLPRKNNVNKLFLKTIYKIDITNPITLLQNTSHYIENKEETILVYNKDYQEEITPVIKDENNQPLVYIYSTHPTETFKNTELSIHNIEPNIKEVSFVLKEKLENLGVKTIVEEASIPNYLKEHNYNYNQSYIASRYYVEKANKNNPNIDLFIDLHRDALEYKHSVATIDNNKYAKIMFVVGLNHDDYQSSLNVADKLNKYLNKNYSGISRGIYQNKSATYNQNVTNNMILIELGGNNNELSEVLNSVDALASAIKELLYEN